MFHFTHVGSLPEGVTLKCCPKGEGLMARTMP